MGKAVVHGLIQRIHLVERCLFEFNQRRYSHQSGKIIERKKIKKKRDRNNNASSRVINREVQVQTAAGLCV